CKRLRLMVHLVNYSEWSEEFALSVRDDALAQPRGCWLHVAAPLARAALRAQAIHAYLGLLGDIFGGRKSHTGLRETELRWPMLDTIRLGVFTAFQEDPAPLDGLIKIVPPWALKRSLEDNGWLQLTEANSADDVQRLNALLTTLGYSQDQRDELLVRWERSWHARPSTSATPSTTDTKAAARSRLIATLSRPARYLQGSAPRAPLAPEALISVTDDLALWFQQRVPEGEARSRNEALSGYVRQFSETFPVTAFFGLRDSVAQQAKRPDSSSPPVQPSQILHFRFLRTPQDFTPAEALRQIRESRRLNAGSLVCAYVESNDFERAAQWLQLIERPENQDLSETLFNNISSTACVLKLALHTSDSVLFKRIIDHHRARGLRSLPLSLVKPILEHLARP
ncbi:MAG: hypothetical protein AAFQ82_19770, partial [Myxococcota bacterium]